MTAAGPQTSSRPSVRSTNSHAGSPSSGAAAAGWNRAPTTVAPPASTSADGPVSGPTSRGSEPIGQCSSMPPVGRFRCMYGSAPIR